LETYETIMSRRSIRKYKTTPIDDKILERVLEAARWAPSWANTQCWRFIVVRDTDIKNKLAATVPAGNGAGDAIKEAPVAIVACAQLGKAGYLKGSLGSDKGESWYMFDVALAMQNLVLAANSLGLGTVYTGWFDAKKTAEIMEVPPDCCVVALTPLGYPDQKPDPTPRKELSQIVSYDKYDF